MTKTGVNSKGNLPIFFVPARQELLLDGMADDLRGEQMKIINLQKSCPLLPNFPSLGNTGPSFLAGILVAGLGRAIGSWHSSRGVSAGNLVCYSAAVTLSVCSMKKILTSS